MAYGLRYYTEFKDIQDELCRVNIYKNSYVGSAEEVIGAADPAIIMLNGNADDPYEVLKKTQAKINLISETNGQFSELYTSNPREFKIEILRNSVVKWSGWVTTENYSEPFTISFNYPVTLTAYDGLSDLEGKFIAETDITEYMTLNEVIRLCLDNTDLQLNYVDGINTYDYRTSIVSNTSPVLTQHYVHKNWVRGKDCEELITSILNSFSARIQQSDNKWYILVPNIQAQNTGLFGLPPSQYYFEFLYTGVLDSTSTDISRYLADFTDVLNFANTNAVKYFTPASKNVIIDRDYGYTSCLQFNKNNWFPLINKRNYDSLTDSYNYDVEEWNITATLRASLTAAEQVILDNSLRAKKTEKDEIVLTCPFINNGSGVNKIDYFYLRNDYLTYPIDVLEDDSTLRLKFNYELNENTSNAGIQIRLLDGIGGVLYLNDQGDWTGTPSSISLVGKNSITLTTKPNKKSFPNDGTLRIDIGFEESPSADDLRWLKITDFTLETLIKSSANNYDAIVVATGIITTISNEEYNKKDYKYNCELGAYNNSTTLINLALQYSNLLYVNDSGTYETSGGMRIRNAIAFDPMNELKAKLADEMFNNIGNWIKTDLYNYTESGSYKQIDFVVTIELDVDGTTRAFEIIKSNYSFRDRMFKNTELREIKGYASLLP